MGLKTANLLVEQVFESTVFPLTLFLTGAPIHFISWESFCQGSRSLCQLVIRLSTLRCMAATTPSSWSNHLPWVNMPTTPSPVLRQDCPPSKPLWDTNRPSSPSGCRRLQFHLCRSSFRQLGVHPVHQLEFGQLPQPTSPLLSTLTVGLAVHLDYLIGQQIL